MNNNIIDNEINEVLLHDLIKNEIKKALLHDLIKKPYKRKHKGKDLSDNSDGEASSLSRHNTTFYWKLLKTSSDRFANSLIENKNYNEHDRKKFIDYLEKEYINNIDNTSTLHMKLLHDNIVSKFNETPPMPYTSLKYHTLLVCAIYYNHLNKEEFKNFYLNYTTSTPKDQYIIIFNFLNHYLIINNDANGGHIGEFPTPNFGDTIGRMLSTYSHYPFPTFIIENLRRIRSWSIGLQYLEDVLQYLEDSRGNVKFEKRC